MKNTKKEAYDMDISAFCDFLAYVDPKFRYAGQDDDGDWYLYTHPIRFSNGSWGAIASKSDGADYTCLEDTVFHFPKMVKNKTHFLRRKTTGWHVVQERPDWELGDVLHTDGCVTARIRVFAGWHEDAEDGKNTARFGVNGIVPSEDKDDPTAITLIDIHDSSLYTKIGRVDLLTKG